MATIDRDFWAGRRVLLTGHTGFKGAWLALWLQELGAHVTGLAPAGPPTRPSLYELARVGEGMRERVADVRDAGALREAVAQERPEVVLHLAAQPLVRLGYREPAHTYEVNVMGTVNVLDAVRHAGDEVRAVVVVTSDKCYENPAGGARRFVEGDPMGGEDPYSSSKACAELVTAAYRSSFFSGGEAPRVATARAGNVIGGGDWGADRLIPDIVRAVEAGEPLRVRNPGAVRPWQHVLNPLSGYLALARELCRSAEGPRDVVSSFGVGSRMDSSNVAPSPEGTHRPPEGSPTVMSSFGVGSRVSSYGAQSTLAGTQTTGAPEIAGAWNFGPASADARTVGWVVQRLCDLWGGALRWEADGGVADAVGGVGGVGGDPNPPEAAHLALDSSKAEGGLGWRPPWGLGEALERVVEWHEANRRGEEIRQTTVYQIERFDGVGS